MEGNQTHVGPLENPKDRPLQQLIDDAFHITGPEAMKAFLHALVERIEEEKAARDAQIDRIEKMLLELTK